jgi:hypothetical protein
MTYVIDRQNIKYVLFLITGRHLLGRLAVSQPKHRAFLFCTRGPAQISIVCRATAISAPSNLRYALTRPSRREFRISLATTLNSQEISMPATRPPSWPLQKDCRAFYGDPRQAGWLHANTVDLPYPWSLHVGNIAARTSSFTRRQQRRRGLDRRRRIPRIK